MKTCKQIQIFFNIASRQAESKIPSGYIEAIPEVKNIIWETLYQV